jgi:surfactin synthase thioesterase subunit
MPWRAPIRDALAGTNKRCPGGHFFLESTLKTIKKEVDAGIYFEEIVCFFMNYPTL